MNCLLLHPVEDFSHAYPYERYLNDTRANLPVASVVAKVGALKAAENVMEQLSQERISWRLYCKIVAEFFLGFYIATFCVAIYIAHRQGANPYISYLLGFLYLVVIAISIKRVLQQLPIAGIMLFAPTAPLIALILVVTLIPILQFFS